MQAGSCLGVTWGFTLAALGGGGSFFICGGAAPLQILISDSSLVVRVGLLFSCGSWAPL